MEHIKESLKHDYNIAVKSFNEKDYTSFFRNIRPAIELLCKLAIYDILGKSDAVDLLEGKTSIEWKRDTRTFKIIQHAPHHKPTGREFCELVPQVYYFKNSDVVTTRYDENNKRLKRGLDSCAGALSRYYSIASELGSHTGNTEMNENVQAISCASFFMGYFDFMKSNKVLSLPTITFLLGLDLFQYDNPSVAAKAKLRIDELISEIEEKETALLSAQKLQVEAEQKRLQAEQRTSEVESQLEVLQNQIAELQEQLLKRDIAKIEVNDDSVTPAIAESTQSQTIISYHFKEIMREVAKGNDIDEESMDDDQLDLIEYATDKSMLVAGCAGHGSFTYYRLSEE